jgi:hypothetical protein
MPDDNNLDDRAGENRREQLAVEAMERIKSGAHWQDWRFIADRLQDGRLWAQNRAHTDRPAGSAYNRAMGQWLDAHPWSRDLDKATRGHLFWYLDHRAEVEAWRETLPQNVRARLNHPTATKRRFDAEHRLPSTVDPTGRPPTWKEKFAASQNEIAGLKTKLARVDDYDPFMQEDPEEYAGICFRKSKTRASRMYAALGHLLNPKTHKAKAAKPKALGHADVVPPSTVTPAAKASRKTAAASPATPLSWEARSKRHLIASDGKGGEYTVMRTHNDDYALLHDKVSGDQDSSVVLARNVPSADEAKSLAEEHWHGESEGE